MNKTKQTQKPHHMEISVCKQFSMELLFTWSSAHAVIFLCGCKPTITREIENRKSGPTRVINTEETMFFCVHRWSGLPGSPVIRHTTVSSDGQDLSEYAAVGAFIQPGFCGSNPTWSARRQHSGCVTGVGFDDPPVFCFLMPRKVRPNDSLEQWRRTCCFYDSSRSGALKTSKALNKHSRKKGTLNPVAYLAMGVKQSM